MKPRRQYGDFQAPHSPISPSDDLFIATEHFMSWVITQDQNPIEHRNILRNLIRILRICEIGEHGHFLNALDKKYALSILHNLTHGLDNGQESWRDIGPATELMLMHLEKNNPKAHAVGQTIELNFAYYDKTNSDEEGSRLVHKVIQCIIAHLENGMNRDTAEKVNGLLDQYLHRDTLDATELKNLEKALLDQLGEAA